MSWRLGGLDAVDILIPPWTSRMRETIVVHSGCERLLVRKVPELQSVQSPRGSGAAHIIRPTTTIPDSTSCWVVRGFCPSNERAMSVMIAAVCILVYI